MKYLSSLLVFALLIFAVSANVLSQPVLALNDDFSGSIDDNWIPGRAANEGGGTHALAIVDGQLQWVQHYDYIESKATFGNDLMIEFDYRGGTGSMQAGEFWIELVALTDAGYHTAGIYRSQYGILDYHAVNIGKAPSPTDSTDKDTVSGPVYLSTMSPGSPRRGKITFTYLNQKVRMEFENQGQDIVQTDWVDTGNFTGTKIRIWGMGGTGGSQRYIDNVKIYAPSGTVDPGPGPGPGPVPGSADYTFVKIADTQSDFSWLNEEPTLNDSGVVAFAAGESPSLNRHPDGIFTGTGGALTTILRKTDANVQFVYPYTSINTNGDVAVLLEYLYNNQTIELRNGSAPAHIFSIEGTDFTDIRHPRVNDNGLVSFWGEQFMNGIRGIFTAGGGGGLTTICDSNDGADFRNFDWKTSINNNGEVAFRANPAGGGDHKIYKSDGTTQTLIAPINGQSQAAVGVNAINNNGLVAFYAQGAEATDVFTGIFTGNGNTPAEIVKAIAGGSTAFNIVTPFLGFNDFLNFAFLATTDTIDGGLFVGPDPEAHKVLAYGDTLDGKEVAALWMGEHCINNQGQIVFWVLFTDDSEAIYRADPRGGGAGTQGCPWCPSLYYLLLQAD